MIDLRLGDCLEIMKTIPDGSVDAAVITDPPYGAKRPSARRLAAERFEEIQNNDAVHDGWLDEAWRALASDSALYLFACWQTLEEWRQALEARGFRVRSCIVWDKVAHGLADIRTCYAPRHEFILYANKGRNELRGARPKDIIAYPRVPSQQLLHPYQKPVELMVDLLSHSTDIGAAVLDPFMGSGATGVACVQTGRSFIGIEIDPTYYEIAKQRIEQTQPPLFVEAAS